MHDQSTADTSTSSRRNDNVFVLLSGETVDKYNFVINSVKGANDFLILCAFGSVEVIRKLLIEDKTLISLQNSMHMNAAHFACYGGNTEVANFLHIFYPELFDFKTKHGLSCKEVAEKSTNHTDEVVSWLESLKIDNSEETNQPEAKKKRTKESKKADENQIQLEVSKARFYLDCFRGFRNNYLLTAAFYKDRDIANLHHFKILMQRTQDYVLENANSLMMNIFHFACYGGNHYAVEFILAHHPNLLTSLTAEGLSGLDVFDMSFNDNPEFREWLLNKNPEFFRKNEKIVIASANNTAPEEQKVDYDKLIQQMIANAPAWNLDKHNKCYINLCTALHSADMSDKYSAVHGLLTTVCEIHKFEGIVVNTTLIGFQKALAQIQKNLDINEKQITSRN